LNGYSYKKLWFRCKKLKTLACLENRMDLNKILKEVFEKKPEEKVIVMHDSAKKYAKDWEYRIRLAESFNIPLLKYEATNANNADLPKECIFEGKKHDFEAVLSGFDIIIALTEFSATAPLSKLAKKHGFRGASMPGFTKEMLPALDIDFKELKKEVDMIDFGEDATIVFEVKGKEYKMFFDLRGLKVLRDDGSCIKAGKIINLPSGETFISPKDKDSRTKGELPIQLDGNVVVFRVEDNHIISSDKPHLLMDRIKEDYAVGNIAELAVGVLGKYGIKPCGRTLLDEKLGLHIALGRNDHFGGTTGVDSFKKKENVWHQDYVYIKEKQPDIKIKEIRLK
jgi:leucyl aminopeptidase (aminopeptidase T)